MHSTQSYTFNVAYIPENVLAAHTIVGPIAWSMYPLGLADPPFTFS